MATVLTLAKLSNDVYDDIGTGAIDGYRRLDSIGELTRINSLGTAFYGAAYIQGEVGVVAFRGSAERVDWLDADLSIALGKLPIDQLGDAFAFFGAARRVFAEKGCRRILVTGHSLGGALTQIVAARITTFPVAGVTFNAPGAAGLEGQVKIPRENRSNGQNNVFNYRAKNDPVSLRGSFIGSGPVSISDDGDGMSAVDGLAVVMPATVAVARGIQGHLIGPLISALARSAEGSIRH